LRCALDDVVDTTKEDVAIKNGHKNGKNAIKV